MNPRIFIFGKIKMRRYTIASVIVSLFALPTILYGVYVNVSDECEYDFPLNRFLQIHAGVLCFLVAIPDVAWQIAKCRGIEIKESKLIITTTLLCLAWSTVLSAFVLPTIIDTEACSRVYNAVLWDWATLIVALTFLFDFFAIITVGITFIDRKREPHVIVDA